MIDRAALSSDRLALRALARRVRSDGAVARPPAPEARFVRLVASPTVPVPIIAAPPAPAARALPEPPEDIAGSGGWSRLLEWCVVDVGVDAAILTDDRGLVIASAGVVDLDDAQGIAARLVIAFHQADRMGGSPSPAMAIQLDTGWLTGLRIDHGGEPLTLGTMAVRPLDDDARAAVVRALARKMELG